MRSIIHYRYGEPAEVLRLTEAPELAPPGPGEVLIRVLRRPVHPGDLLGIRGRHRAPGNGAQPGPDGARPGVEGMGVIEAAGAGIAAARGLEVGARVAFFPARWAWSERVLAPARCVVRVPDQVSDAVAAQLHVAPLTALMLLRATHAAGARRGDVVVLSAAGSLVARLAARLLLADGYLAVGVVRSEPAVAARSPVQSPAPLSARLPAHLLDMPQVCTGQRDWPSRVCALTRGRPVRVALDAVGGEVAGTLAAMLADGGTLVSYGDLSAQPMLLPALPFSARGIAIQGVSVGRWPCLPEQVRAGDIALALGLARDAPEAFGVAAEYALEDVAQAVRHAERAGKHGAVLLR